MYKNIPDMQYTLECFLVFVFHLCMLFTVRQTLLGTPHYRGCPSLSSEGIGLLSSINAKFREFVLFPFFFYYGKKIPDGHSHMFNCEQSCRSLFAAICTRSRPLFIFSLSSALFPLSPFSLSSFQYLKLEGWK